MRTRSRFLRLIAWIGLAASVFILAVYALSLRWSVIWPAQAATCEVRLLPGALRVRFRGDLYYSISPDGDGFQRFSLTGGGPPFWGESYIGSAVILRAHRSTIWAFRWAHSNILLPLWIPFLLVALPTAFLWRRTRRVPPGHCHKCRYDLTGNTTGICPECGAAAPHPRPVDGATP
jgi:hypothetical protein